MRSLFLLSAALLATCTSADHVLVLGQSPSPLWHESRASTGFSAAGLADLALNSLGLRTGRVSSRSAVQSPLQADIFTHSEAYALIMLDDTSSSSLTAVNAALSGSRSFHGLYPTQAATVKVPVAVAQEFGAKYPSAVHCAGSAALCAGVQAQTPSVSAELVQKVLVANSFLSVNDAQDVAFATELAQVLQLTTELKQTEKTLYLVGLSGLQGDKQKAAQQAATTAVTEFLAQLMKSQQVVGAQVMTGALPTAVQQMTALARNRKLVTKLSNEEEGSEEDESESDESDSEGEESDADEDSDAEDEGEESGKDAEVMNLAAASGSVDDDNATVTATNATAPGAVSMPDIAEYQIILWTSVLLGAILLMAILAMANMDAGRDSLLYAKFIADVNGRKTS
ncbi:hypothetical protein PHMEG_0003401 [Phytophthora megakarya]|uniref:Uncharacterized protein n=1 Tax=Phytophthora megakarya TaxID=4795 RepID=A0A225WWA8_9STRA|nr:hypothetical protein PHMEG_0003401 [Phytophthora megakarya]